MLKKLYLTLCEILGVTMARVKFGAEDVWSKREIAYVKAAATDISKTIARAKKQIELEKTKPKSKVLIMKKRAKA